MDRRQLLKTAATGLAAMISPSCRQALESGVDLSAMPVGGRLSDVQLEVIAVLAELIIPSTDTPGASEAGVAAFIHQIVVDWYTDAERQIFLEGLAELDAAADRHWSSGFIDLTALQQTQLLSELEPPIEGLTQLVLASGMPPGASGDLPFYVKLKELTVLGYYTSEVASNTELDYQPVPGHYDGHALFDDRNRQWTR